MTRNIIFKLICCMLVSISGCGYTTSSIVSSGAKTIYVDTFINKIKLPEETTDARMYIAYKSGMEVNITRDIIDRFILDGNLKIAGSARADLVLKGDLIDFRKEPLRYDTNNNVLEYRVKVVVNMELFNESTHKLIWKEAQFTGESTYSVSGVNAKTEDAAVKDAIKDLAVRVVERVVEDW